jgi:hypothetical protein
MSPHPPERFLISFVEPLPPSVSVQHWHTSEYAQAYTLAALTFDLTDRNGSGTGDLVNCGSIAAEPFIRSPFCGPIVRHGLVGHAVSGSISERTDADRGRPCVFGVEAAGSRIAGPSGAARLRDFKHPGNPLYCPMCRVVAEERVK